MDRTENNPIPSNTLIRDKSLFEEFSSFFMDKIQTFGKISTISKMLIQILYSNEQTNEAIIIQCLM